MIVKATPYIFEIKRHDAERFNLTIKSDMEEIHVIQNIDKGSILREIDRILEATADFNSTQLKFNFKDPHDKSSESL